MPWVFVPMKDVLGCVKLRGAAKKRYYPEISEWGNPIYRNVRSPVTESLWFTIDHRYHWRALGELKQLSSRRNKN